MASKPKRKTKTKQQRTKIPVWLAECMPELKSAFSQSACGAARSAVKHDDPEIPESWLLPKQVFALVSALEVPNHLIEVMAAGHIQLDVLGIPRPEYPGPPSEIAKATDDELLKRIDPVKIDPFYIGLLLSKMPAFPHNTPSGELLTTWMGMLDSDAADYTKCRELGGRLIGLARTALRVGASQQSKFQDQCEQARRKAENDKEEVAGDFDFGYKFTVIQKLMLELHRILDVEGIDRHRDAKGDPTRRGESLAMAGAVLNKRAVFNGITKECLDSVIWRGKGIGRRIAIDQAGMLLDSHQTYSTRSKRVQRIPEAVRAVLNELVGTAIHDVVDMRI